MNQEYHDIVDSTMEPRPEMDLTMPHGVECSASYYMKDGEWFLAVNTPTWLCAQLNPGPNTPVRTITGKYGAKCAIVRIRLEGSDAAT